MIHIFCHYWSLRTDSSAKDPAPPALRRSSGGGGCGGGLNPKHLQTEVWHLFIWSDSEEDIDRVELEVPTKSETASKPIGLPTILSSLHGNLSGENAISGRNMCSRQVQ